MNRVFKTKWSAAHQQYVVTDEHHATKGKASKSAVALAVAAFMMAAGAQAAYVEPGFKATSSTTIAEAQRSFETAEYKKDWGLAAMHASKAYALGFNGNGVTVGVMDSGALLNIHPDLTGDRFSVSEAKGNYGSTGNRYPQAVDKDKGNVGNPFDKNEAFDINGNWKEGVNDSHGTHVTGTVGGNRDGSEFHGVAWGSDIIVGNTGATDDNNYGPFQDYTYFQKAWGDLAEKVAAANGNRGGVINNSWGKVRKLRELLAKHIAPNLAGHSKDFNELYGDIYTFYSSVCATQIMNELLQNSKVDFLIVQSSGNGYGNGFTAYNVKRAGWFGGIDKELRKQCSMLSYDLIKSHIMIVGSVGEKKKDGKYKLRFNSNYGDNVDIVAPGEHIYSTVLNNSFGYKDGTSMAAPIVSGSAAYIWSLNPGMSAAEVKQRLIDTAEIAVKHAKEDTRSEYPMLNLGSAATSTIMGTVNGEIKDQNGNAITGVLCKRTCEISNQQVFNMDLNFSDSTFIISAIGRMTLTFQKDGYETQTTTVNVSLGQDIKLKTIVMRSNETEDSASELEKFARNYQYLCEKSETYDGYIYYPNNAEDIQGRSDLDPQPLTCDIEDYDGDGADELLIVNLEPYTDMQSSTIRLQMYEVENGTVRLAAEHLCQATYNMITGAEVFQKGDTRVFKYQQNNQWILAAEQSVERRFFDGHGDRLYMEVQYDGNQFQVKGVAEGETGSPDEELIKEDVRQEYAALGLNVDVDQIFSRKKHIYDYIDNPVSLAKTEYYYDYSKVEQDQWCKFGYITVSMQ